MPVYSVLAALAECCWRPLHFHQITEQKYHYITQFQPRCDSAIAVNEKKILNEKAVNVNFVPKENCDKAILMNLNFVSGRLPAFGATFEAGFGYVLLCFPSYR